MARDAPTVGFTSVRPISKKRLTPAAGAIEICADGACFFGMAVSHSSQFGLLPSIACAGAVRAEPTRRAAVRPESARAPIDYSMSARGNQFSFFRRTAHRPAPCVQYFMLFSSKYRRSVL